MIFHENRLTANDSHELSCLICFFFCFVVFFLLFFVVVFLNKLQNLKLSSASNYKWRFMG